MTAIPRFRTPPMPPAMPTSVGDSMTTGKVSGSGQASAPSTDFADLLTGQVKEVNGMQNNADEMVHSMLTGGDVNQAEVLTAVQKADLAFRMMLQIRNKLMDAYREVQQIQI